MTPSTMNPLVATMTGRRETPRPSLPHRLRGIASGEPNRGTYGQKSPRPNRSSAAGRTNKAKIIATTMPTAHASPRARLPASSANSSVDRARATVEPLAMIAGPAPRSARRHRVASALVQAQFVSIARDEQEGVVGPGAEDEHRQDAGDRRIQRNADRGRDKTGHDAGERVGDSDDDERDEPQPRAPVGDQQQDRHDDHRGQQQREVRAREDRGDIDLEALRAGQVDAHSVEIGGCRVPQLLCALGLGGHVRLGVERDDDERDGAVIRDLGRRNEAVAREVGEIAERLRIDRGQRLGAELSGIRREDEQRGGSVRVELLLQLLHLHGLRAVGKTHRRCRLALLAAAQREQCTGGESREDKDDPRRLGGRDESEEGRS